LTSKKYDNSPTFSQFIVIIFATIGFLSALNYISGCADSYGIYAGAGESFDSHPDWERPSDGYGTFGAEANFLIHERDDVLLRFNVDHRSQWDRDSPGDNTVNILLYKRFE